MSVSQEPEVFEVLRKIRYDLTAAQAKVTEALNLLGAMSLPASAKIECQRCGVWLGGELALATHLQNVHDGPPVPLSETEEAA
jgi:hypothetical protein